MNKCKFQYKYYVYIDNNYIKFSKDANTDCDHNIYIFAKKHFVKENLAFEF